MAFLVFDTLFGTDDALKPQPQMAEGYTVDEDGKRWTIKLREGLAFHDKTPVLAGTAWPRAALDEADSLGGTLARPDRCPGSAGRRTLVFRLKRPFPPLLTALAKTQPSPAMIMPERIAATDPFKQITEVVGSGPFRFVADEYVAGQPRDFRQARGLPPAPGPAQQRRRRQARAGGPGWSGASSPKPARR